MTMTVERREGDGFTMIPDWLVESSAVSLHDYAVLIVLMKHARTSGQCHPGFATIAKQARVSRDTVKRSLRSLEERGLISIERRRVGTKNLPNLYTLHVEPDRVGADSTHSDRSDPRRVGADSTQVGADSTQGWVLTAPLTRLTNESHERDSADAADDVHMSAIEIVDSPGVSGLDLDASFDAVWSAWPKKTSKKTARAKFTAAARRHPRGALGLAEHAAAHARAYVQNAHPVQYVPMLSTWLNGDRWNDPLPGPRRTSLVDQNASVLARYAGGDA